MSKTRSVHVVRCKDPNNPDTYCDVKVIDAIIYHGPPTDHMFVDPDQVSDEHLLKTPAKEAVPAIIDRTPGGPHQTGDTNHCSRVSHMKRMIGDDASMIMDVEILDGFAYIGPNERQLQLSCPDRNSDAAVIDKTGHGLDIPKSKQTTRVLRCDQIVQGQTPGASGGPNDPYLIVERVEAMAWQGNNAQENLWLCPHGDDTEIDTTKYTTDNQGNKIPPDNADPNVYISFPDKEHGGPSAGPWLGKGSPLRQGPLWWVVNAHGGKQKYALFCVDLNLGYFGQSTGPFTIYVTNANFPVFGDGVIWDYPFYQNTDAPATAVPSNQHQVAPIPQPPGSPTPPSGFISAPPLGGNMDVLFKYNYSWCLDPWVTPGVFGFGGTNVFGLNLNAIRGLLGVDKTTNKPFPITFDVLTSGTPDTTEIGPFVYSFFNMGFGGVTATNLSGLIQPHPFDPPGDILAAFGFYDVGVDPPFSFFGKDHPSFFFNGGPASLDIVPYLLSTDAFDCPIDALYNKFTNTGNYFPDDAPVYHVTIDGDDNILMSGSFGTNINNFQLFVF